MINEKEVIAVILFGGEGRRFGWHKPKQFFIVNGKTIAEYTLEAFENNSYVDNIIVVSSKESIGDIKNLVKRFFKVSLIVEGGDNRTKSSMNGVLSIKNSDSFVLIHDGARPLVTQGLINSIVENLTHEDAVIPCLEIVDTIAEISGEKVVNFLDREKLCRVQTPQGFRHEVIFKSYKMLNEMGKYDFPDDSSVVKYLGISDVCIVRGEARNIKITTMDDISLMKFYLNEKEIS